MRTIKRSRLFRLAALALADLFTVTSIWAAAPLPAIPPPSPPPWPCHCPTSRPPCRGPRPRLPLAEAAGVENENPQPSQDGPSVGLVAPENKAKGPACPTPPPANCESFFGPQRYDRTKGSPTTIRP